MAENNCLPFLSISNYELVRLSNSDTVSVNYSCINEIDQVIFNPIDIEQDTNSDNTDSYIFNTRNMTQKFSQYIYLDNVYTNLNSSDIFSVLSMNIRSLANNLQILVDQCFTDSKKLDVIAFSETSESYQRRKQHILGITTFSGGESK